MTPEIRSRAYTFVKEHAEDKDETQQSQQFLRDFIGIFNEAQAKVGYEFKVNVNGSARRIDYLWAGVFLVEMKGRGIDFDKLEPNHDTSPVSQAMRYYQYLADKDKPKYLMVCNFERMRLYDLAKEGAYTEFLTADLPKYLDTFDFLLGKTKPKVEANIDPVNEKAALLLERLHRQVLDADYPRNYADLLLTRLVFCFFADDTQIFPAGLFEAYLQETAADGTDLINKLADLFDLLNTKERPSYLPENLQAFPYINGGLFKLGQLRNLPLTAEVRRSLLEISSLDWSKISPVIFGSMFEGAMGKERRHSLGAHYTSEKNILKVVDSLFMDDLRAEFAQVNALKRGRKQALDSFHTKLAGLRFLDPACGSGNFLIVAYRELRRLEHQVIDAIVHGQLSLFDISEMMRVEVAQFYGIEIVAYAVSISRLGLWLMDHLMNLEASRLFGRYLPRLPLHAGGNVVNADALKVDWLRVFDVPQEDVSFVKAERFDYVLGNPPFIGNSMMDATQKATLEEVTKSAGYKKIGHMDFVAGWYIKGSQLMKELPDLQVALVSTNSICQGEQAINIWENLMKSGLRINFAHQTFKWDNNGAAVFVVIVGFAKFEKAVKTLFSYEDISSEAVKSDVKNINQYLLPAPIVFLSALSKQISGLPEMLFGSKPVDGGFYIFTKEEKGEFVRKEPNSEKYFKQYIGSQEAINGGYRYMLYVKSIPLAELRQMKYVQERVQAVKSFRLASKAESTRKWAERPLENKQDAFPNTQQMLIPGVSSERREYVPFGFFGTETIINNAAFQISNATLDLFALLQSKLHMAWLDTVGGRLKGDYRYSNTLVYNTFAVPELTADDKSRLAASAQKILDAREIYSAQGNSLADMYDPLLMPLELRRAHNANDKLVDSLYGLKNPTKEARVAKLMEMYEEAVQK